MLITSRKENMVKIIFTFMVFLFFYNYSFAHLCHDPFKPVEHLVLVPEKDIISIEESGEFRIYVENTFRSTLEYLKLLIENDAFDVEIEPPILKNIVPGERTYFLIKLKLRQGFKPGNYPLKISVAAESAVITPSIEKINVVAEEKPQKKPEEQVLPPPLTKTIESDTPLEEDKLLRDIELEEEKCQELEKEKYKKPKQEKTQEPEKNKYQKSEKPISQKPIEEKHNEEIQDSPEEIGEITIKVEKIPLYKKPYFYLFFILLLLGIFIWRKIR